MPNNTFIKLFHNLAGEEDPDGENGLQREGTKQDELQSIQYVDQNYVESSLETDNEGPFAMGRAHESKKDVKILYNPAKNKSKSLGRVGPTADQFNQLLSKESPG